MKTIRIGIVGCGRISRGQHVKRFMKSKENTRSEIVAVYDIKTARAKQCLEENKTTAKICKSLDELLAEPIDAVVVATPNDMHAPITLAALAAGKHVFVEKPMAGSLADAEKMIKAAEDKGLVLQVDQSFRYMPLYQAVKKEIDKGTIGDIIHVHCIRIGSQTPNVSWSPGADWYVQKKHSGGVVFDHAVHMADVLQWFAGPIKKAYTTGRTMGYQAIVHCMTVFDFANGATGTLEHGWQMPTGKMELTFYGTKGYISFNGATSATFFKKDEKEAFKTLFTPGAEIPKDAKNPVTVKDVDNAQVTFLKAVAAKKSGMWAAGREAITPCVAMLKSIEEKKPVALQYHKEK